MSQKNSKLFKHKYRAEQVREEFLSARESGVAPAIRNALRSLFREPRLPDNPYLYLANNLNAYVDQSRPWLASATEILSSYDADAGLEVLHPLSRLCRLDGGSGCYGLPHVLRAASQAGVDTLHALLRDSLPDSFFPSPLPVAALDGYTVTSLASLQGIGLPGDPSVSASADAHPRNPGGDGGGACSLHGAVALACAGGFVSRVVEPLFVPARAAELAPCPQPRTEQVVGLRTACAHGGIVGKPRAMCSGASMGGA
ncbi:MAG: hypothetical protein WDW38_009787 [Sanguina aurantia]